MEGFPAFSFIVISGHLQSFITFFSTISFNARWDSKFIIGDAYSGNVGLLKVESPGGHQVLSWFLQGSAVVFLFFSCTPPFYLNLIQCSNQVKKKRVENLHFFNFATYTGRIYSGVFQSRSMRAFLNQSFFTSKGPLALCIHARNLIESWDV